MVVNINGPHFVIKKKDTHNLIILMINQNLQNNDTNPEKNLSTYNTTKFDNLIDYILCFT